MAKSVIVTLSNSDFVSQAKQLFSSVYHNAGWKGDYLLLAHELSNEELKWFREKKILIYSCEPLYHNLIGQKEKYYNPVLLSKLYLFTDFFKQWDKIVFIDADVIVRAPINEYIGNKYFSAVKAPIRLFEQYINNGNLYYELNHKYDLTTKSFNSGFLAFPSKLITNNMLEELMNLFTKYHSIIKYGDEGVLNLYFFNKWKKLPSVYNYTVSINIEISQHYNAMKAIVYHFLRIRNEEKYRPWHPDNIFYKEWKYNLANAENIVLSEPKEIKDWSFFKVVCYSAIINNPKLINMKVYMLNSINKNLHRLMGIIGVFIKRIDITLYYKIKKIKGE